MPRLSQLLVHNDLIASLFVNGTQRALPVANHLPGDAVLFGVYNAHPGLTGLVFEHASFPESPAGLEAAMLPMLASPTYRACPPPGRLLPSAN